MHSRIPFYEALLAARGRNSLCKKSTIKDGDHGVCMPKKADDLCTKLRILNIKN